jgi:hypothetical protein
MGDIPVIQTLEAVILDLGVASDATTVVRARAESI